MYTGIVCFRVIDCIGAHRYVIVRRVRVKFKRFDIQRAVQAVKQVAILIKDFVFNSQIGTRFLVKSVPETASFQTL